MKRGRLGRNPDRAYGHALAELAPPVTPVRGASRWVLPALMTLYLVLAIAHALRAPVGSTGYQDAPDEAAHIAYVRAIAHGHLPSRRSMGASAYGYEWHQPPLYYVLAAPLLPLGVRALRLASIICGLLGVAVAYRAARLLFPDANEIPALAAGFVALLPGNVAITSAVSNDALLELSCSVVFMLWIAAFRGGLTLRRAVWLGVALAVAILAKSTALLLLPVALIALIVLWRGGESRATVLQGGAWICVIVMVVDGWWFARNHQLYGEWIPVGAFELAFRGTVKATDVVSGRIPGLDVHGWPQYWWLVLRWSFQSFWAVYGTAVSAVIGAPRFLPVQAYWLAGVVSVAPCAGLLLARRGVKALARPQRDALGVLVVGLAVIALAFVAFLSRYFQAQGRYMYPAIVPISLLFAAGWHFLVPARYRPLATGMLLAALGLMSLAFLRYVGGIF